MCRRSRFYTEGCKIKREKGTQTLVLKPTRDIAASLGQMKHKGQLLIGFALETNDEEANALYKLKKKNLDFIVLNSLKDNGAGFMYDTNKITLLSEKEKIPFSLKNKKELAKDIIDKICDMCD